MSKNQLLIAAMLGFVVSYASYQLGLSRAYQPPAGPALVEDRPRQTVYGENQVLHYEPTRVEFGEISGRQMQERSVRVSNPGPSPVTISSAKASCSCTMPVFDDKVLEPGAETELVILLNPSLAEPVFTVSVSVSYQGRPEVDTLQVSGTLTD